MEIGKRNRKETRPISISRLFLEYLAGLTLILMLLVVAVFAGGLACMQAGVVLPANYADEMLNQAEARLTEQFDKSLLPPYCKYILMDADGALTETDMDASDMEKARDYFSGGIKPYYTFYRVITQENGHVLIVKYDMLAHFRNPLLHKLFPYPEWMLILLLLCMMVLLAVLTALRFSKRLKQNLTPIITAAQKIEEQDLDFEIEPTQIREFNASLEAIDQLKKALSLSLQKQWDAQHQKKAQLSALAHDIKTPLTIVKGNTDLLLEQEASEEKTELLADMRTGAVMIEQYLELLMQVVHQASLPVKRTHIELQAFMDGVLAEARPLCRVKEVHLSVKNETGRNLLYVDGDLMKRAVINVIDNGVRYSERGGRVALRVWEEEPHVIIEIRDYGKGFSEEGLRRAAEAFYTDDPSRTSRHYGLGLSFVQNVVQLHDGFLKIENKQPGAAVTLAFEADPPR